MEPTVSVWPVTTIRTMPLVRAVWTACWTTWRASAVRFDLSKSKKTMKVRTAGGGGGGGGGGRGGGGGGRGGGRRVRGRCGRWRRCRRRLQEPPDVEHYIVRVRVSVLDGACRHERSGN